MALSSWLAVIKLIYNVTDSNYIFLFVFTLNVYLWILPSRLTHSFEVNENFMLSWIEIIILLLNKALSLKRRGTHLGLPYQNAYSWERFILIANINRVCFFINKMSNLPLLRRRKSSCVITERKQYIYQGHFSMKSNFCNTWTQVLIKQKHFGVKL